jgi:hypothetical protein
MFSRYWTEPQQNLHITSKELLAVINAINKWKTFLITKKFYISTDSNNIPYLFKMRDDKLLSNNKHLRWIDMLSQYNFEVKHIKGIENKVADFLSRLQAKDLDNFKNGSTQIQMIMKHTTVSILIDLNKIYRNISDIDILNELLHEQPHNALNYNDIYIQIT